MEMERTCFVSCERRELAEHRRDELDYAVTCPHVIPSYRTAPFLEYVPIRRSTRDYLSATCIERDRPAANRRINTRSSLGVRLLATENRGLKRLLCACFLGRATVVPGLEEAARLKRRLYFHDAMITGGRSR